MPGSRISPLSRAHSIERRGTHGGIDSKPDLRVPLRQIFKIESIIAKVSPGVGQRFPFSAPLLSPREVSVVRGTGTGTRTGTSGWYIGEIANMTNKASGRAAFILAIGLLAGFAGPSWAADPQTDAAGVTAPANQADPQQAAPADQTAPNDQLSASDRAAQPDDMKTPVVVTQGQTQGQPDTPAARPNPVVAGSQSASWDETSLIGKIFIGFGALLTVASAARMFMA
jgi:hypothetical protein